MSGFHYKQLVDGIHRFELFDGRPATIDAVVEMMMSIDQLTYLAGGHARFLLLLEGTLFTPYVLQRTHEAAQATPPKLVESTAVVGDPFVIQVIRRLIYDQLNEKARQTTRFFMAEDEALAWLHDRHEHYLRLHAQDLQQSPDEDDEAKT